LVLFRELKINNNQQLMRRSVVMFGFIQGVED
jgi:hypothetical protein